MAVLLRETPLCNGVGIPSPLGDWEDVNRWEGSTGKALAVPAELDPLVEALKRAAALSDETAQRMADENRRAFQQVFQSLAIPKAA